MKPPKSKYATPAKTKAGKLKPVKRKKITTKSVTKTPLRELKSKRIQSREVQKFKRESRTKKIFLRSLLGAVVALVLFVVSTMFTPLLSIDEISVSGNDKVSEKAILKELKPLLGSPLPMVSEEAVATSLSKFKIIESIALVSKPPHALEIRITERTAIAIVRQGQTDYLFDPAGINVGKATGSELLPTILIKDNPKSSENYKQAMDVLLALPAQLLKRVQYIQAKTRDNVSLQLRGYSAQSIIWGDSSQSILKSKVLKTLLLKTPTNIRATFDVSSPRTPSVIR